MNTVTCYTLYGGNVNAADVYVDTAGDGSDGVVEISNGEINFIAPNFNITKTIGYSGPTITASYESNPLSTGVWHTLGSVLIDDPGVYIFTAHISFPSNSTGSRKMVVSASTNSSSPISSIFTASQRAVSGDVTWMNVSGVVNYSGSGFYYINAYQDSGTRMSSVYCSWSYVRIV